jgi:hypothetical protein
VDDRSLVPQALANLDPSLLTYDEWLSVGMAMQAEGMPFEEFHAWSAQNTGRYKGESDLMAHWRSFSASNSATPVNGGTIVELARRQGWDRQPTGHALDWSVTSALCDPAWVEPVEIAASDEKPTRMLARYLEALFEPDDIVGYVFESQQREDGKWTPANKGDSSRTARELIEGLAKYPDDMASVIGKTEEGGAWIRFNPLDGQGVRNDNVTDFRYALVECDELDKGKQLGLIRSLNLPCAAIVDSGGKSVHAIVHVDAADLAEYRKRVDELYAICRKNGLPIDAQNKNPSRLSRMPGVMRGDHMQALIGVNEGPGSWDEWCEWIEDETDDLPEMRSLDEVWDDMPPLAPFLIKGVLRQGHKMTLTGPSKAGKSLALMELAIAITEGCDWLGFECAQGPVVYVNLEIDEASCMHRFRDLYETMGIEPRNLRHLHVWTLRGRAEPMDKLAHKLERRAKPWAPAAIILDPIYKVITGDENSASEMARFMSIFDHIATETGAATIICHHHSKGAQGFKKSQDRFSGSGVFARDPDALVDMTQLDLSKLKGEKRTGWQLGFTLREFADPGDVNVWFDYPRHYRDEDGALSGFRVEGSPGRPKKKDKDEGHALDFDTTAASAMSKEDQEWAENMKRLDQVVADLASAGETPVRRVVAARVGISERTLMRWIDSGNTRYRYADKLKSNEPTVLVPKDSPVQQDLL